ncbi:MAG TPA: AsmA-like C-terminal region-containing protein [Usitatibacteraceae bacterium]
MDLKTVFTKTAKGVTQVNQKTQSLSKDLMKVLKVIDGKSTIGELADKADLASPAVEKLLVQLQKDGFAKVFEVKQDIPLTDFGGDDDFDFTTPVKRAAPASSVGFGPSPHRKTAADDQVARAEPASGRAAPRIDEAAVAAERAAARAAEIAAAQAAQAQARARAEREAQVRARLEVEARARKEAELRAMEEAKRAQEASERARADLEAKVAAEKKQRESQLDTHSRMTQEQLAKEAEQQKMLAAARAKAETEAQALAAARARAEAEAKALAEARAQADVAAQKQKQEFESAQRDLRQQLKAEIEAQVRAEMETMLKSDIEESARGEVEAAVLQGAQEDARRMLEERLAQERDTLARAETEAKNRAEIDAKRMLAEQEAKIRAEMELRIAVISKEKERAEAETRRMAEQQAAAAAKASAELATRLKAEEEARALVESQARAQRLRLEARAREEAEERARVEAEMAARLAAEKEATIRARAQALIEQELREKAEREGQVELEAERRARGEAEQKALREAKAREVASRAISEHAAERERIEREAEERVLEERALRQKAEKKSRRDEEAEAASRAAQVARLRELQEQAERASGQGEADDKPKRRGPRKQRHLFRWAMTGLVGALVLAVVLVQVVPLQAVNARLEKSLAGWVHDDVSSSNLRVSLFPRPHLKLDQLALGKLLDAKASSGTIYMDLTALFGDRFIIDTVELSGVTVSAEALARAPQWGAAAGPGATIEIGRVVLKDVKLEVAGVTMDAFDADLRFDKAGVLTKAALRAGSKWTLDLAPDKTPAADGTIPAGAWKVDFSAQGTKLPIGPEFPITDLKGKGSLTGSEISFPLLEIKLLEGSGTGSFRADWKQGINFSADMKLQKIKLDELAALFTRNIGMSGRMEGEFSVSGSAATLGAILDRPKISGSFALKDGSISNIDLVQAMRSPDSGGRGGQSKFTELTGQLNVADGVIRYEKLKLTGGVLLANGTVVVGYDKGALSGNIVSEIRSKVAQDRAAFGLAGSVARPMLKRGG